MMLSDLTDQKSEDGLISRATHPHVFNGDLTATKSIDRCRILLVHPVDDRQLGYRNN
jgi:hypothetical protein